MDSWNLVLMGARFFLVYLNSCADIAWRRHVVSRVRWFLKLFVVQGLVLASGVVGNVLGVIADEDPRRIDIVEL